MRYPWDQAIEFALGGAGLRRRRPEAGGAQRGERAMYTYMGLRVVFVALGSRRLLPRAQSPHSRYGMGFFALCAMGYGALWRAL